jgi:hypothetical protein
MGFISDILVFPLQVIYVAQGSYPYLKTWTPVSS